MSRTKQQLVDLTFQLDNLRADLNQTRDQFAAIDEMAEDASIRAIVSETPGQSNEAHDMFVAKERLEIVMATIQSEIDALLAKQDELLEKLFEETKDSGGM